MCGYYLWMMEKGEQGADALWTGEEGLEGRGSRGLTPSEWGRRAWREGKQGADAL